MMAHLKRLISRTKLTVIIIATVLASGCSSPDAAFEITDVTSPTAPGSLGPHLALTRDGEAVMSWLEPIGENEHAVRFSILQDDNWSAPVTVAEDDGWFVNTADFPSVVPITTKRWISHWLVKKPGGTYSYDIALSTSSDGGASWSAPTTPHTDNTPTEHGFVTIFPWSDDIGAVWLDGRNMKPDLGDDTPPSEDQEYGGMTLRFARFNDNGELRDHGEIDDLVCECCQTDVALTTSGPVVAYRNRTTEEVRDIQVSRYIDGGWTDAITVSDDNWQIRGCPVNGPAIDADGDNVVVAWYGAPNRQARLKLAWSQDTGRTFSAPMILDDDGVRGRVDVVLLSDGSAMVSWMGKTDSDAGQLRMRRVTRDGTQGPIRVIAAGEYSRNSGFPQMIRTKDRLVFAWPEPGEPRKVLTAFSPLK